jgi:protease-4
MEEKVAPAVAPGVQPIYIKDSGGRTALWTLLGVSLGFLLPTFSCALLMFVSFISLALAGSMAPPTTVSSTGTGDAVAIVRVAGAISSGDEEDIASAGAISGVVIADLERAAADPTVKAIVLRVDSPGGTVTGSAQIYEAILALDKPVVVSMLSLAASGGYYVSAPADYIFARPDTTTGSIGVIYTVINAQGLLQDIGVEVTTVTSGPNKDFGNPWGELTEEQRAILQTLVDESYAEFVRVVAEGRDIPEAEVRALADGRIYSGRQALALGLVDELGDLEEAIGKAADLGGISGEPRVIEYEHEPTLSQLLFGVSSQYSQSEAERVQAVLDELSAPSLEYRYVAP